MITSKHFRVMATVGMASLVFMLATMPAVAENSHMPDMADDMAQNSQAGKQRVEAVKMAIASKAASLKLRVEDHQEIKDQKLADNQLKACQNRQQAISNHAANTTKAVTSLEGKFAAIAAKVVAFKDAKGITVSNYDSLVADVAAKKTAVDTDLATATSQIDTFSCDSTGPKAQLQLFVSQMDIVRQALKDYRTSIKNLIQGVRAANGQNRQPSASATTQGSN